ncbi:MAG: TadE/TadG family type IV pilus assembly protein [Gammaproteobacteria bacterium]
MLSKLSKPSSSQDASRRVFDIGLLQRFHEDTHGGVLVYMAIMLPVLLGVSGLALDASLWYAQKRSGQAIADTAAYTTVKEIQRTGDETLAKSAAKDDAITNGFDESAGDSITFNFPPKYGDYAGTAGYYEVIVERPAPVFLSGLFLDDFNTAARAVSGIVNSAPPPCLLALDKTAKNAIKVNSGTVEATGCNIQVNSDHSNALYVPNQGSLEADPINVVGDYSGNGYISSTPNVNMPAIADPLAGLPTPEISGCDYNNVAFSGGSHTLSPGVYCGGITLTGSAQVELDAGNYVIADGTNPDGTVNSGVLSTSGNTASLTGDGVSFYFDGATEVSTGGTSVIDLSAPTSGTYTGILFYGDPYAPTDTSHAITGGGNIVFDGVMYFPTAEVKYNGNGVGANDVLISAIMAREIRFGGNGTLEFHFSDDAILPPSLLKLTLVE